MVMVPTAFRLFHLQTAEIQLLVAGAWKATSRAITCWTMQVWENENSKRS